MASVQKVVLLGGSWGGIQASLQILEKLPATYPFPIVLVLHRLRNAEGNLQHIFKKRLQLGVQEVEDKMPLQPSQVYLAPANYHVLLEKDGTFSLDVSDLENYSRPSIDVTFTSAADVYKAKLVGILLSGASKDGSAGLKYIHDKGGVALVQDPSEAEVSTMPEAAMKLIPGCHVATLDKINEFLLWMT